MKLITRDIDYAVRALVFLAQKKKDKVVSAAELTGALRTPQPFLRKILQRLNKNGLLKSYKGNGGGFSLAIAADKISLAELLEIFHGSTQLNDCVLKKKACFNIGNCVFRKKIGIIERQMVSQLRSISINSLLD